MTANLWDECTGCSKSPIDIRTEIIKIFPDGKIRKMIVFRCADHIEFSVEELLKLSKNKKSNSSRPDTL